MSAARCLPPSFIGQGEVVTRVSHNEMHRGCVLANNTPGVTVVLANPCAWHGLMASFAFRRHHGGSCACWGIALRGSFDWGSRLVAIRTPIEGASMLVRGPRRRGEFKSWCHRRQSGVVPSAQSIADVHIAGDGCTGRSCRTRRCPRNQCAGMCTTGPCNPCAGMCTWSLSVHPLRVPHCRI
jgi:hypothetical protein